LKISIHINLIGVCLTKLENSKLIKQKNLKIDGIDIDAEYLAACD
jgi:hypothetical protein